MNKEGREYVDSRKVRKKRNFADHCIARNDFFIFAGRPVQWKNEIEISDGKDKVICDAMFKWKGHWTFLEVDIK
ncbi:replication-relaxation family protein, partial [Escherichia coli]|uniref:replication-relaxation family protein n=1 Tax=Escherichia coli TaxID=562 RepID=UPI00396568D5